MTKRRAAGIMLGFGILFSACIPLINCNGMLLAFITDVRLENRTDRTLHVVPVGVGQGSKRRGVVPVFWTRIPAIPAIDRRLTLRPGETKSLLFDWDDYNLSELALVDDQGNWRQLVVLSDADKVGCCRKPKKNSFVIRDFESLHAVSSSVKRAAVEGRFRFMAMVLWFPLAGPFLLLGGLIWRRRLKHAAQERTQAGKEA